VNFSDGTSGRARLESDLGFVSLEARAALPISFGRHGGTGFFVVPKIGAGLLIDSYGIDNAYNSGGFTYLHTSYHDGAAFDIRPGIQAGYSWAGDRPVRKSPTWPASATSAASGPSHRKSGGSFFQGEILRRNAPRRREEREGNAKEEREGKRRV